MKVRGARLLRATALIFVALCPAVTAAEGKPTADELLRRLQTTWNHVNARLDATMTVVRAGHPDAAYGLVIDRDGSDRARIEFVSPKKDQGKVILLSGSRMWLYLPRAEKVTEVSRRRNPLAGGVLFDDLTDVNTADADTRVEERDDGFVLELRPRGGKGAGIARIVFDKGTLLPRQRDVLSSSGKLIRSVAIDATRPWHGVPFPAKLRVTDASRTGGELRLEITRMSDPPPATEGRFDPERLGANSPRPADRAPAPARHP